MTRDLMKVSAGIAIGAVLALAVAVIAFDINLFGGRSTRVTLSGPAGGCMLGKETVVLAKVSEDLSWKITNRCPEGQKITVGNFRTDPRPTQPHCRDQGTEYPFEPGRPRTADVPAGGSDKIKLKVKAEKDLPNGAVTYYFDICLGDTKADPKLEIEKDQ